MSVSSDFTLSYDLITMTGAVQPKDIRTVLTRAFDESAQALRGVGVLAVDAFSAPSDPEGPIGPRDAQTVLTRIFDSAAQAIRVIVSGVVSGTSYDLTYDTTILVDPTLATTFKLTLTGDCIINMASVIDNAQITFIILQDGTGGHTVTFNTNCKPNGTLTDIASAVSTITFIGSGTSWLEVSRTMGLL